MTTQKERAHQLADGYYDAEDLAQRLMLALEAAYEEGVDDATDLLLTRTVVVSQLSDTIRVDLAKDVGDFKTRQQKSRRQEHRRFFLQVQLKDRVEWLCEANPITVRFSPERHQAYNLRSEETLKKTQQMLLERGWETHPVIEGVLAKPALAISAADTNKKLYDALYGAFVWIQTRRTVESLPVPDIEKKLKDLIVELYGASLK